jgi:hypothetical protein
VRRRRPAPPAPAPDGKIIAKYTKTITPGNEPTGDVSSIVIHGAITCEFKAAVAFAIYDPINDNCLYVELSSTTTDYLAMRLGDVLAKLFTCYNLNGVSSDFFIVNPVGDAPGYLGETINYVTTLESFVNNIMLCPIENVDVHASTTVSDSFEMIMSITDILSNLNSMFNVFWFIDAQHRLRIEHESYFTNIPIADVSSHKYNKKLKSYTYLRESLPNRETFKFVNSLNTDNVGADIVYNGSCTAKSVVKKRDAFMTTDIHYLRNNSEAIQRSGFVMIAANLFDQFVYEPGVITGISMQNNHLSWANLHDNFHRHGRVLPSGLMNYQDTNFETWKKRKKQNNQTQHGCCLDVPEIMGTVTTEVGVGDAIKITLDPNTGTYDFELEI